MKALRKCHVSFVEVVPGQTFWFLYNDLQHVPKTGTVDDLVREGVFHGPFADQAVAHADAMQVLGGIAS